ncbi:MAG: ATP-binding protein [Azoarcus sp.]|jgi:AAA15 family ATPase/GTPase|nr:ATP-binding protein [Azoarcus sp.]
MLVEFRVKNFRSFRDEQVLSLVASKDKTLLDTHTLPTGIKAAPHLLKSAVIYGANASGKSNLIKALRYMRRVMLGLENTPRSNLQPFRLDEESSAQPSEFKVTFILDGVRHQYGFAMTQQRIVTERLLVYKTVKPQCWFDRRFDESAGKDIYTFSPHLKGAKSVWEEATRPDALFLSTAKQLNSKALKPVFDWFKLNLFAFDEYRPINKQRSIKELMQDEDERRWLCDFLSPADTGITNIEVDKDHPINNPITTDSKEKIQIKEVEGQQLLFTHTAGQNQEVFNLWDESSGTRRLFFLAGYVRKVLRRGGIFVMDELDTSLHPHLVRELVRLFYRPETNAGGAQLIFTTHNTSLLEDDALFRRDQIWLVEKKADQSSTLYSLLEFSPRKNEAIGRGYLQGRYGAVPIFGGVLGDG